MPLQMDTSDCRIVSGGYCCIYFINRANRDSAHTSFLSETLNSAVLCCMNKSPVMNFRCVIIIITLCLAVSAGLCSRWKHCV